MKNRKRKQGEQKEGKWRGFIDTKFINIDTI
jgi:hypothetical protein